jgi:sec-independent protein translocase protein TatA
MPIHPLWLLLILLAVLLVFGPSRLPELGSAVGKAMREFRKATTDLTSEVTNATKQEPQTPPAESAAKGSSSEAKPSSN